MEKRVIVALDFNSSDAALHLVDSLDASLCRLKIGKELFTACGPELAEADTRSGLRNLSGSKVS